MMTDTQPKKNKKSIVTKMALTVFVLGLLVFGIYLIVENSEKTVMVEQIVETAPEVEHIEYNLTDNVAPEGKSNLLSHYESISPDVIARLYVADSGMETAIVNSDFYFRKDLSGNYNAEGIPYAANPDDLLMPSKNTVIYGHRLDGFVDFGMLRQYLDQTYYESHPVIKLETDEGTKDFQIISVFTFNTNIESFNYPQYTDFTNSETRDYFLKEIKSRCEIKANPYTINTKDTYITLSTCHYETDKTAGRLVVVAKSSIN